MREILPGYEAIKKRADRYKEEGHTLPAVSENIHGEKTIISEGKDEDGRNFFVVKTLQYNGWIAVNTYYEDGSMEETFER